MSTDQLDAAMLDAARDLLDADAIAAQVDAVLSDDLYWFPVRHHSPAVARHLSRVIAERQPKLIFIEGPHEANDLIKYVVDAKTKPPVAIYSSYRDDDNVLGLAGIASPAEDIPARFACWYPLVAYSPEYVALRAAARSKTQVMFMDLPHYAQIPALRTAKPPAADDDQDDSGSADQGQADDKRQRGDVVEREDDRLLVESGFFQQLARTAGFRNWQEAWDSLFELKALEEDTESFRHELATFCAAARATSSPARLASDGTLDRERFMWQTIQTTLKREKVKPADAMVICGGFHLFLDREDKQPPPQPPPGTVYTSVVPYSYFRISELSGYGAGNRAPQFYQRCWELWDNGRGEDLLAEHVVAVLNRARKEGEPLSSADAIAVTQHARMLARLRGRTSPVLDDIRDALVTCCCKGDPAGVGVHLLRAMDAVDIGAKLGRVTPALGRLPIVNDFYAQLDDLELGEVMGREKRLTLDLDKREPLDSRRSALLHRLAFLDIPLCKLVDSSTTELVSGTIFRQRWDLRYSPKVEAELIERNLYGDTIEAASLAQLEEDLARHAGHAGETCERLVWSINMDLPGTMQRADAACGKAIDEDSRFVSLCDALTHLTVIDRYAEYRGLTRQRLDELIIRCYDRACFALPDIANVPEEQQAEVVESLKALAEVVQRDEARRGLDRALFGQHVRAATKQTNVAFLRGALLGMLAEIWEIPPDELADEISALARGPVDQIVTAGDLIDGIMAVSRSSLLLGAESLVAAMDELLETADWEAFLTMIPRLRAAFERLHERHVDSLAGCVARRYGLAEDEAESLTELKPSVGAAAMFARIDAEVARIMQEWEF